MLKLGTSPKAPLTIIEKILKMLKFPLNKNASTFPTPGEVQAIAQYNLARQHKSQLLESIYFTSHVAQNSCY
jgi:hypothetical protein